MSGLVAGLARQGNEREHFRVTVSWRARVVLGPQSYLDAKVVNVSEGGFALQTPMPFKEGALLTVALAIPHYEDRAALHYAKVEARVVFHVLRNDEFRVGLQFKNLDEASRRIIEAWLRP